MLHKLHTFFKPSLIYPDISPADAWLEYEDVPLKWHYPLGLLYDLYAGVDPAYPSDVPYDQHGPQSDRDTNTTPWTLTIHYSGYPSDQLVKLDTEGKHLHDLFIHSVKEVGRSSQPCISVLTACCRPTTSELGLARQ